MTTTGVGPRDAEPTGLERQLSRLTHDLTTAAGERAR
jgi:hypothetical protein